MDWFSGTSQVGGSSSSKHRQSSNHHSSHSHSQPRARSSSPKKYFVRSHSPARSTHSTSRHKEPETKKYFVREHSPARSSYSSTSRGLFNFSKSSPGSSASYYKRGSRPGYVQRLVRKIRQLLRDLIDYAKRNPTKLFMAVILPLITGGALTKILATIGLRLPAGLSSLVGGGHGGAFGAQGRNMGAAAGGIGVSEVVNIAKMFM